MRVFIETENVMIFCFTLYLHCTVIFCTTYSYVMLVGLPIVVVFTVKLTIIITLFITCHMAVTSEAVGH